MIELPIHPDTLATAQKYADAMGCLNNSITSGEGNLAGIIGELTLVKHLPGATWDSTFDYDIRCQGYTIDVKSTRCNSKPNSNYNCHVALTSLHQRCDYYAFTRVLNDCSKLWVLGCISREKLLRDGIRRSKGEIFEGFEYPIDCLDIKVSGLNQFQTLEA